MDTKKLIAAIVVGYLFMAGAGYLIHEVWLSPLYQQSPDTWRPEDQFRSKMWIMWLADLLFVAMFAYIYTRGVENKPWLGQGIRYGVLMALLVTIPLTLSQYVIYRVPDELPLRWIAAGALQLIVLGLIVAGFCRKPAA